MVNKNVEMTTLTLPVSLKKEIKSLKQYPQVPDYVIIQEAVRVFKKKKKGADD